MDKGEQLVSATSYMKLIFTVCIFKVINIDIVLYKRINVFLSLYKYNLCQSYTWSIDRADLIAKA
jgi:hypothetical protein